MLHVASLWLPRWLHCTTTRLVLFTRMSLRERIQIGRWLYPVRSLTRFRHTLLTSFQRCIFVPTDRLCHPNGLQWRLNRPLDTTPEQRPPHQRGTCSSAYPGKQAFEALRLARASLALLSSTYHSVWVNESITSSGLGQSANDHPCWLAGKPAQLCISLWKCAVSHQKTTQHLNSVNLTHMCQTPFWGTLNSLQFLETDGLMGYIAVNRL